MLSLSHSGNIYELLLSPIDIESRERPTCRLLVFHRAALTKNREYDHSETRTILYSTRKVEVLFLIGN